MGWNEEEVSKKKGMDSSLKILLGIIACVIMIIILIIILLVTTESNTFKLIVDGEISQNYKSDLIETVNNTTYINIQEFSELVGYEYHEGEYKEFTVSKDKCYVKGTNETASFYLNDNKVCKLPVDDVKEDYEEYTTENMVKQINGKMYAATDAITLAFNSVVDKKEKSLSIYTLKNLVTQFDAKAKKAGYASISAQEFENQKSILYGYLILKKENGLYKIMDTNLEQEIVPDKYNSIEFIENTKEFFVTNSLGQVGILNIDGTVKIEPIYDSIKILDKESDLYLIKKDDKYGVVKSGNVKLIYPEYDSIGIDTSKYNGIKSQYILLDTLIPVCKDGKYGAFDKQGNLIIKTEYEKFGCDLTTVDINGIKKEVNPLITIEKCKGIVVSKDKKYGILNTEGKELVPIAVESIYMIENENKEKEEYFMLYNGTELNIIDRLIAAGLIESDEVEDSTTNNNNITNEISTNNNINTISNSNISVNNTIQ